MKHFPISWKRANFAQQNIERSSLGIFEYNKYEEIIWLNFAAGDGACIAFLMCVK